MEPSDEEQDSDAESDSLDLLPDETQDKGEGGD